MTAPPRLEGAQFPGLADAFPHMLWTAGADGSCICFNRRWLDYSGLSLEASIALGWTSLIHPDDRARVTSAWQKSLADCAPYEAELRLRAADGSYRWMLCRALPQLEGSRAAGWLGTFTDIHPLKENAESLEKNLYMLQIAGRVARLGGWTIDLPEHTLTWSDENCLIHDVEPGCTPSLQDGIGYFLPEDRETVRKLVRACAEHGTPYEFILQKKTAKGRLIWVRSLGEAVRDATGKIVRLQGAFQDISEHKEAEARMRALEMRLISTLESITDGFYLMDRQWCFTYLNGPAEKMLRRSREELLGQNLWEVFPEAVGTPIERQYRLAVEEQRTSRFEFYFEPLQTWFVCHVYPTEAGIAVYFQDITETRQAQALLHQQQQEIVSLNSELEERVLLRTAQLATANREMESFAYSVSHDLRSPLNTIHAFSQLLVKFDGGSISGKGKHYLERIQAAAEQMGGLIEGLLTLAKLSREQIRFEDVDLSAIARLIERDLREREPQRQVQVCIQGGLSASGDARLLFAVFQNLLGNAWKFTSRRELAQIDVGCAPSADGHPVFFVRDNGAGFDMAFAHKLFGTFERLHSPGDFAGTGIGLATVKRVVERHGGRVWAEGRLEQGATFYLTLGRSAPVAA